MVMQHRKDLAELIVAVETKDPKVKKLIGRIKGGFTKNEEFHYGEILRRKSEALAAQEVKE